MGRLRGAVVLVAALAVGGAATLYTRHRPPAEPYFEDWTPRHEYPRSYVVPEGLEIDWPRVPVEGRVFDADGEPLVGRLVRVSSQPHPQGVSVLLGWFDTGTWVSEDVTDERGHYRATTLLGGGARVEVLAGGPESSYQSIKLLHDPLVDPDKPWDLHLPPGLIECTVRDEDGRAVSGVHVEARPIGLDQAAIDGDRWAVRGRSDWFGRVRMPVRLLAHTYLLTARDGERVGRGTAFAPVQMGEDGPVLTGANELVLRRPEPLTLVLREATPGASPGLGWLRSPDLVEVEHSVTPGSELEVLWIPDADSQLWARIEWDRVPGQVFFAQSPSGTQHVTLPQHVAVPVRVVDASGEGVPHACVRALIDAPDTETGAVWADPLLLDSTTDASGRIPELLLPADPCTVSLWVYVGGRPSSVYPRRTFSSNASGELVLTTGVGTGVRGRVVDASGVGASGAWVVTRPRLGDPTWDDVTLAEIGWTTADWVAVTDDDGHFDFAHQFVEASDTTGFGEIWVGTVVGGRLRTYEPVDLGPERVEVELRLEE